MRRAGRRRALALLVGVGVILAPELTLRAAGWGAREPFFVQRADGDGVLWWLSNPEVGENWFRSAVWEDAVRHPRPQRFRAQKTGRRVFVVGESAVYGTPWADDAAWPALLGERLRAADGAPVEVINTGVRAVSLGVLPGVVTELRAYEPDAFVLYAGNNEYYGVREPTAVDDLRLVRLLAPLVTRPARDARPGVKTGDPVPPGAARHAEVSARAETELAAVFAAAGPVPVLVVPPVGNERDLAPLGSVDAGPEVAALVTRAEADPVAERAAVEAALVAHPDHAALHHALGLAQLAAGESPRAELQLAVDLDTVPVRPRSDLRARLAASAWVCDAEPALRAASPDGLLGWPVLVDHVHLGLGGGAVLADAVAACLAARPELGLVAVPGEVPASPVDAAVGLRAVERYVATSALAASPTAAAYAQRLDATIATLEGALSPAERAAAAAPPEEDVHARLARDPTRTLAELERATHTRAGDPALLRALAEARLGAGDTAGAQRAEAEAVLWASLPVHPARSPDPR